MALAAQAYKYYRLVFKGSFVSDNKFTSFAELRLFEDLLGEGINLCIGAIATSSGSYEASTIAQSAIDNNPATYYESENINFAAGTTCWFKVELPEPKVIRSYYLTPSPYPAEFPLKFEIQGSNDNVNWERLYENLSVPGTVAYTRTIASYVGGVSRLTNGQPTKRVIIYDWVTGQHLLTVTPDSTGNWFASVAYGVDVLVTHIGPAGYRPESDGPITPYYW